MIERHVIFLLAYGGNMAVNIFYSIKDLPKEQNLAIAYYFYTKSFKTLFFSKCTVKQ